MILDRLANASLYHDAHPGLAAAFAYLARFDDATADGRQELDGERLYALVQRYVTRPAGEKRWESHRRYLDVQYLVAGRERIDHAPLAMLQGATAYDEAKDVIHYAGPAGESSALCLEAGDFAAFFPEDGHRPGVTADGPAAEVRKVVVKVLL